MFLTAGLCCKFFIIKKMRAIRNGQKRTDKDSAAAASAKKRRAISDEDASQQTFNNAAAYAKAEQNMLEHSE